MIQPHELRVGNWIWDGDMMPMKVESVETVRFATWNGNGTPEIHLSSPTDDYNMFSDDRLNGIPLTPAILSKCGFVNNDGYWHTENYSFSIANVGGNDFRFEYDSHLIGADITHLHQLQNLYCALTGQELPVAL